LATSPNIIGPKLIVNQFSSMPAITGLTVQAITGLTV